MTETAAPLSLLEHFTNCANPRREHGKEHLLLDIIAIGILAMINGANDFVGMAEFGVDKEIWLRTFLKLPNGIPSHDTFGRVFERLKPSEFQRRFSHWVRSVAKLTDGDVIAIDGKTPRRSHHRPLGQSALELVNAWAQSNRLTLGQRKVAEGAICARQK